MATSRLKETQQYYVTPLTDDFVNQIVEQTFLASDQQNLYLSEDSYFEDEWLNFVGDALWQKSTT